MLSFFYLVNSPYTTTTISAAPDSAKMQLNTSLTINTRMYITTSPARTTAATRHTPAVRKYSCQ